MLLSEKAPKVVKNHKSNLYAILPIFSFWKSAKLNLLYYGSTWSSEKMDRRGLCEKHRYCTGTGIVLLSCLGN